jgi:hypothetical protein
MEVWHDDTPEPANDNGRLPWPEALFAMFLLAVGAWGLVYLAARALGVVA